MKWARPSNYGNTAAPRVFTNLTWCAQRWKPADFAVPLIGSGLLDTGVSSMLEVSSSLLQICGGGFLAIVLMRPTVVQFFPATRISRFSATGQGATSQNSRVITHEAVPSQNVFYMHQLVMFSFFNSCRTHKSSYRSFLLRRRS